MSDFLARAPMRFEQSRLAECLVGEAHLCEEIARACADERKAVRFRRLAHECRQAAAIESGSGRERARSPQLRSLDRLNTGGPRKDRGKVVDAVRLDLSPRASPRETISSEDNGRFRRRVNEYAAWVAQMRTGYALPKLVLDGSGSLNRLGRELQDLARCLDRRECAMQQLFDLAGTAENTVSVDQMLNSVFDNFTGVIPFERIGCAFLSDNGTAVTEYWARSNCSSPQISAGYTQPLAGSSLMEILETGKPRILDDLEDYLSRKRHSDATRRIVLEGGRSSLTCPLVVEHRPIGFLFFTSGLKNAFRVSYQVIFREIAGQVSAIIDNARMYPQLIERNRQLIEESRRLAAIASRDPLTGALNHGAVMRTAERALAEAAASRSTVGIIMADIDHFKAVNDSLGHPAGDAVLKEFTRRLGGAIRQTDQFGRYGGEEFLIIITGATSEEALQRTAERLRQAIVASPFMIDGEPIQVSASFGAALSDGIGLSVADVIAAADRALYAAKDQGRNRVVVAFRSGAARSS